MKSLFFHGTTTDGARFTVCGIINGKEDSLKVSGAICSKRDPFVKKIGRLISEGRIIKNRNCFHIPLAEAKKDETPTIQTIRIFGGQMNSLSRNEFKLAFGL